MAASVKSAARSDWLILAALTVLAVLVRVVGLHQRTADLIIFVDWYTKMSSIGVWRSLGVEVGNYNAPFLYVLAFAHYLPGAIIIKIKTAWMIFDVLLAFFTFKIVKLKWPSGRIPVAATLIMVLLPTVVINASYYGQMDSMWASFAVGGVYFLLRGRYWWGVSLCTVAFALKPQGMFIFPLVALLILAGYVPWRSLLVAPLVYVGLDIPAIALGRHPIELLTIYSLGRQEQNMPLLASRAPSAYAFVGTSAKQVEAVWQLGYLFTAALVLGICYVLVVRRVALTKERIVSAAALFVILMPFFLPGMHERYFFLADVMTVLLVFFRPRLWFVPLLVQSSSLLAYQSYLFRSPGVPAITPMRLGAGLMLAAMLAIAYDLLRDALRPSAQIEETPTAQTAAVEQAKPVTDGTTQAPREARAGPVRHRKDHRRSPSLTPAPAKTSRFGRHPREGRLDQDGPTVSVRRPALAIVL